MVCVVRCRWKLPSYWMGGYLLCLLHLVLGCDLLPFLVVVSGVLFWALLLDAKGLLFFLRTLIKRMLFRDGCFGPFMTDRTQELRWTGATVDAVAFGSATVSW